MSAKIPFTVPTKLLMGSGGEFMIILRRIKPLLRKGHKVPSCIGGWQFSIK
jgi:hypothetical protein